MAKEKAKGQKGMPDKHLHARLSFLHQAATYFATQSGMPASPEPQPHPISRSITEQDAFAPTHTTRPPASGGVPSYMSSQLRQVARKAQLRLHQSIKHASCKSCSAVLIEGQTCRRYIENLSRDGGKPHADVLVIECQACGTAKRFPVGAKRQQRKSMRTSIMKPAQPTEDILKEQAHPITPSHITAG